MNGLKLNLKNTVKGFNRFLGLQDNKERFKEELKYIEAKCNNDQIVTFELRHHGEQKTFTLEQLLAAYFCKLQRMCKNAGVNSNEVVISVPPYLTSAGRQTILDAAKIANFNCRRIINETTAIGLFYGLFRSEQFIDKPRHVMFIDMGYSKLTISIMKFETSKFTILAQDWNANLGARNLDDVIAERLVSDFKTKYNLDLKERPKAMIRLYEAVKRAREILSANKEVPIVVESIMEEQDIQCNLTREDFEILIAPYLENIRNLCIKVLEEAKVEVDVVEMVGETTRTPSIIREVQECAKINVSRTMNSADCIARGCAIQCAMLSSSFKVTKYDAVEYNTLPVDVVYKLPKSNKTHRIFKEGINFPIQRILKLQSKDTPTEIQLTYPEGIIRTYKLLTNTHYSNLYIKVALDENMNAAIKGAETDNKEEYSDMEMEDNKSNDPQKINSDCEEMTDVNAELLTVDEYMRQGKTEKKFIGIQSNPFGLTDDQIKEFTETEAKMQHEDSTILTTKERKNELESYVYEMRAKIDNELKEYIDKEAAKDFLDTLNETENWLFTEGENRAIDIYDVKLKNLKEIAEPVIKRKRAYEELNEKAIVLDNFIKKKVNCLHTDEECSPDNKQKVYWTLNSEADWLGKAKNMLKNALKTKNPPISSEEFDEHIADVQKITNSIKRKSSRRTGFEEAKTSHGFHTAREQSNKMEQPQKKNPPRFYEEQPKSFMPNNPTQQHTRKQEESSNSEEEPEEKPQYKKQKKGKKQQQVKYGSDDSDEEPKQYNPLRRTMQQPFRQPQSTYFGRYNDEDDDDYVTNLFDPRRRQRRTTRYNPMSSWMPFGLGSAFDSFI